MITNNSAFMEGLYYDQPTTGHPMILSSLLHTITGTMIKRKLGKGKQKDALVNAILTEEGLDFIIRHEGGTAFSDPQFDTLIGKKVKLTGTMQSYVMVISDLETIEIETKEKPNE